MMKCANCGGKLIVLDTASDGKKVYRVRMCKDCHKKYGSIEAMDVSYQEMTTKIHVLKKMKDVCP